MYAITINGSRFKAALLVLPHCNTYNYIDYESILFVPL